MTDRPTHLVVDAFGTICHLAAPTRPYARLREFLAACGAEVSDFPVMAMTRPVGLAAVAEHYGVDVPTALMASLEADLFEELNSLRVSLDALACLRALAARGVAVTIGSNLALPYGVALKVALGGAGFSPAVLGKPGDIACAFSYEMGLVKPDPRFYSAIARVAPPDARFLMVGDKLAEDHKGPLATGWEALPPLVRCQDGPQWRGLLSQFDR